MCNAWNHPPGCNCGWGGDGHPGSHWGGGYGGGGSCGAGYGGGGHAITRSTFEGTLFRFPYVTYPSYVNPNAKCPVCGASVYFYQSPYGGRVFFDELGPPWPKHPCTDSNDPFSFDHGRGCVLSISESVAAGSASGEAEKIDPVSKAAVVQSVVAPWVEAGWMPFVVTRILPRRIGIEAEGKLLISATNEAIPFRIVQTSTDARFYRARGKLWIGFSLVQNSSLIVSVLNECPILLKKDPNLEQLILSSFVLSPTWDVEEVSFQVLGFALDDVNRL